MSKWGELVDGAITRPTWAGELTVGRNDWLPRACVSKHYVNVMVICHATQLTQGPRDNGMVSRDSVVVFEKSPNHAFTSPRRPMDTRCF